jgi:glucose uptake protein GlcU
VLLNQRAYQQSRISVSTPVLNIAQLLVSLTFGVVVLDEQLLTSPLRAIPEVVGLAVMLLGVSRLALRASEARSSERSDDSTRADELDDEHA